MEWYTGGVGFVFGYLMAKILAWAAQQRFNKEVSKLTLMIKGEVDENRRLRKEADELLQRIR